MDLSSITELSYRITLLFTGQSAICPSLGLAATVPPSVNIRRNMTYLEAKDVCAQNGLALHNKRNPWTAECTAPFLKRFLGDGASFFDINDIEFPGKRYAKPDVICTAFNLSIGKCCSCILGYNFFVL